MADFNGVPFADWLEDVVKTLIEEDAQNIAMAARLPDDRVFTAYYMCDAQDKAVMASNIQADITMDIIKANIDTIKDAMESLNDGEGGEDGQ